MASDYTRKQADVALIQEQMASGKKIIRPSDDPAVAVISSNLKQTSSQYTQYDRNSTFAEARLTMEETALASVSNVLLRMKELALGVNNDTLSPNDDAAYLAEVKQQYLEIIDYANIADPNGDFLFAGNKVNNKPFVGNDTISYTGDDESIHIQIGSERSVASSDAGTDVFMKIRNGNGDVAVTANPANTGTGIAPTAEITNRASYSKDAYRIDFTSPTTFDVINESTGVTVLAAEPYKAGENIAFEGLQTYIGGTPAAGDSFTIAPSTNQDVFTTVNNFIDILTSAPTTDSAKALRKQKLSGLVNDLDQAFEHINSKRSEVGTRLVYLDNTRQENEAILHQIDKTVSGFEDLDYADAVTRLERQSTTLEAMQATFARIESLSMFDYLR
ncbi:unnamed protein product [Cyprideis torosa]|uniref:Uncharacterized protein n=1 Tax=Cyprideis torosa TaxID=163714 RepID=A0A7R8ZHY4_9CRUS|nr:unnamed protein product [Cyprideis torosa]CAG0878805.1 unnamed protein product [Cyprideis torosa]